MFAGNSNPALVKEICDCLGIGQGDALVSMFSDGEIRVQINENVRGKDVFLCQSCCDPVNKHLMELLLMLDALKRSSARAPGPSPSGCRPASRSSTSGGRAPASPRSCTSSAR